MKQMAVFACVLVFLATALANEGTLQVGDPAPDFNLPYATGDAIAEEEMKLSDVVGSNNIVLAFYPANWTGGCTKEMCTFRDSFSDLSELGATVFGISGDDVKSHHEWAKELGLQFALLSDREFQVARAYNSFNEKSGRCRRTVFVIDREGKIAYIDPAYSVAGPESFDNLKNALASLR
jgi:peroxiredoxin